LASPEYTALSEFVPVGSPDVLHPAYPELRTTVPQPVMTVDPFLKATVPVAPVVTMVLKFTTVPTFWVPEGEAVSVVVVVAREGDVAAELLAEGPDPPALEAKTLNVYEVEGVSPGTLHEVLEADAVQVNPPGLEVTV